MTLRIIKREKAKHDLIELADFIAHDNLDAAYRFITASENAFQLLSQTPGAGAPQDFRNPVLQGLRMWPIRGFEKHLVFYREIPDGLEIVRILHASRDIEALFTEE